MVIIKRESSYFPQTQKGRLMADEYEHRLKKQFSFISRNEGTEYIEIVALYQFKIKEDGNEEENKD